MIRGASYPTGVFESFLIHDVTVWRPELTADGQGGYDKEYIQVGTMKGRMSINSGGTERFIGAEYASQLPYTLFTMANVDLQREDIVAINGNRFRVKFGKEPSHFAHHIEWACEEIDPKTHQVYAGLPQTPPIG